MVTQDISLDVVICTYNHAALLDRALAALVRQRPALHLTWRILVVNNNCTDDTEAVVARHARAAPVPLTMVHEPEQGLTPARRRGVVSTGGDWIAFVDDDCLLDDDWVQRAAEFARAHPDCGAFGGMVVLDWETSPPPFLRRYGWAFAEQRHGPHASRMQCLAGAGLVVRRSALADSGWIERQLLADRIGDRLVSGGDVEIALRVGSRHDLWYNPKCRLRHYIPEHRTSRGYLKSMTYGLGTSKLFGDSMLWSRSYPRWLVSAVLSCRHYVETALRLWAKAAVGHGQGDEAAVTISCLRDWCAGIYRLFTMDREMRHALLGCAAHRDATGPA